MGCWCSRAGVVAAFRPTYSLEFSSSLNPVVVDGAGNALVVVGRIGRSRVAAVAPYLFADDSFDNVRLSENIVKWLLTGEVKEESEYSEGGSVVFKNLTEARVNLSREIEELRAERDRLLGRLRV